ncbi:phosphonate ABC transporter, permease protein PhnE [Pseudosulfitobacter pseudonitzschiae]|uniref:phosphonate ABC transporter, permease protein PhnE n=1 Tax=Pseudosulfitobacter pseudonitzschiae TaxID=1402135 RepID=UPI001AF862E7|nr:phosphonate ABC transporter, permease protein PhnE [Pseudosulfitobacter pseudonitzschiae]MBM1813924.1 phosphonate ABC transporter, permease protein PhnE [Pseudosulfitobacter pseudonitzschiae]MBM1830917.1 phosphonate ABC transporter, permease protein PhnE [Pseudosulfitobacter pseudonitzschiae]MBM1835784.1 phosphonate ABC transporter, permease protein PhnE [Pseudosulfitobacter pseudonitzschiae]MBM1840630.1 phosphonate ABC transporter, permease protein PhnE [Pseudosulfitobacter pseudonitzschiae
MFTLAAPAVILAYLTYVFIAFDVAGLADRVSLSNMQTLVSDTYSYKVHVTRDNRDGATSVAIEGERKGEYPEGTAPDWVTLSDTTRVDLANGAFITLGDTTTFDIPGYGTVTATPGRSGVNATFPPGDIPEWINASKNRVAITADGARLTITRNRTEVFRYFYGWELFFFTLDSPFHGKSVTELLSSGQYGAIWSDFWSNKMWRHADVAWALFETVLMAFLGTFGAAMIALPLGFLAAKNFTPLGSLRFAARRVFDFLRGVDGLIWTIVLSRAFGPGPLTGSLAIMLTDTGTFGKIFSEALENVDDKQIEGIASTGAKPMQRYRFGVIPQITPVLLSQVLYYLESNTRSATIIGAITGGGIGLLLTQAIITQKDWEEVSYYIILIILMVMAMDSFSGWLRRRLIQGTGEGTH